MTPFCPPLHWLLLHSCIHHKFLVLAFMVLLPLLSLSYHVPPCLWPSASSANTPNYAHISYSLRRLGCPLHSELPFPTLLMLLLFPPSNPNLRRRFSEIPLAIWTWPVNMYGLDWIFFLFTLAYSRLPCLGWVLHCKPLEVRTCLTLCYLQSAKHTGGTKINTTTWMLFWTHAFLLNIYRCSRASRYQW